MYSIISDDCSTGRVAMLAQNASLDKTYMICDDPAPLKSPTGCSFTPPGPILVVITGNTGWPDTMEATIVSDGAHYARRVLVPGNTKLEEWTA